MPSGGALTQEKLTRHARRKGQEKARRDWRYAREHGREALTKVGNQTVREIATGLLDLLVDDLEKLDSGKALVGAAGLKPLKGAAIGPICLAVVRAAVNGMTVPWVSGISMQAKLGAAAEDAILETKWQKLEPEQAAAVRALIAGRAADPTRRRVAHKAYAKGWQREILEGGKGWDERTTKTVGTALMGYLVRLEMFEHRREKVGEGAKLKWTNGVCLTERATHWISNAAELHAAGAEIAYPSVDPPIPWSSPMGGGFHGRGEIDHPSIPSSQRPFYIMRRARREHKAALAAADLRTVYAALNAAQATPWRINRKVYVVFDELRRVGKGGARLTAADNEPRPEYPEEAATDEAARARFKAARREYYARQRRLVSRRVAEHRLADTARLFKDCDRFHFVYNVDFRGRVYACSEYLSPQGDDLQRGLLEFVEGDPLTPEGEWWLKLHIANSFGKGKDSFSDRIAWADENAEWFQRIAQDPIGALRSWENADSPWQFLAGCFAWDDYKRGDPLCRLPVMLDGSCSGIQHSAALVADAEAGEMVNLVPRGPHEKPADIYAVVAERAVSILREREAQLDRHAHYWLTSWGVTRDDTKSSVMTLPYGGTKYGNPAKVQKSVEKQIKAGKKCRPEWLSPSKQNRSEYKRAIKVLSDAIWEAMSEVVRGPLAVMQYVRDCATTVKALETGMRKAAKKERSRRRVPNLRLCWTSPCGFPVLTDYRVPKTRRTELRDAATGRTLTFTYYAASAETDWREVVGSAPPHFIHSLDASHLMRSVARAQAEAGIDQIAIVHDAFGTTPSKVGALAAVLRDEFARMYSEDVLGGTLGEMLEAAGATPPPPPSRGALDVTAIAQSGYLFA